MTVPSSRLVRRASLSSLLLGVLAGAVPARAQDAADAALAFHLGQQARRSGDHAAAARWLAAAVDADPEAVLPRLEWASVLLEAGIAPDVGAALLPLAAWWEARPAGPDPLAARYARLRAAAATRLGDDAEAIRWYEEAVARSPFDLGLRAQLIGRYRAVGDGERSLVHLAAAADLMPGNAELRVEIGAALLALERWSEAEAAYGAAAALDPFLERAWDGLGQARSRQGDHAGAEQAFRRGLQIAPASAAIYEHLGDALLGDGRVESALQAYERAATLAPHEPRLAEKVDRARAALPR